MQVQINFILLKNDRPGSQNWSFKGLSERASYMKLVSYIKKFGMKPLFSRENPPNTVNH